MWRRLGSEVTVVEFLDRITPGLDGEIAKQFQRILHKQGMKFQLSTKVVGVEKKGDGLCGHGRAGGGRRAKRRSKPISMLVAIGRRPYTDGLGLDEVGVAAGQARPRHHRRAFRTNVAGICAIGDCREGAMLAHKAEDEAVACIENIAGKRRPCELRRHSGGGLHRPGSRQRRQDGRRAEGRRRRLQDRQISLHRQCARQDHRRHRRLREDPGRRQDRPRAGRAHHGRGSRQSDRRSRAGHRVRRVVAKTSPAPAIRIPR